MNTCGNCIHWIAKPKAEPPKGMAVVLDATPQPQRGDCRCLPPTANVAMVQQGRQTLQIITSAYPDLPENFPACGEFQRRLWAQDEKLHLERDSD